MKTPSQQGKRYTFDALVIGSGIAGLSFCLELLRLKPQTQIALISKTELGESNSYYAQGGIAAVYGEPDSFAQHTQDTLLSGDGLSQSEVVKKIIHSAPQFIETLTQYGVAFDQTPTQTPDLTREGGHTQRRIFHSGDQTGKAVIETLIQQVHALPQITCFESHMAVDLLFQKQHMPGHYGEVFGAYVLNEQTQKIDSFLSKLVVLATGGAGKIYRYTTNPDVATGDGLAMAYRIGARVSNLEFYQFHPTLLYHPALPNFLISEAVRGEGGYLRLPDTGERFMQRYAPEQMELATRDVVARAIFTEIENNGYNYVHLDIKHRPKAFLESHFPNIYRTLLSLGIDMSRDPIPVVPAAHYQCGGILTDTSGHTDLKRLYAIGEVACTGFHGANRLASNSLSEAGVMATECAKECAEFLNQTAIKKNEFIQNWRSTGVTDLRRASQINAHWRGLRGEMTSYAGIVRTEAGLKDLLHLIITRRQMIEDYYWKHIVTRDLLELRNIILVAELIVHAALKRKSSRGGHYREDYQQKGEEQVESILFNNLTEFF